MTDDGDDGQEDLADGLPEDYAGEADRELSAEERAEMQFNFRVVTPPLPEEISRLQEKETAVDWLGFVSSKSPIETTFGAEDDPNREERFLDGLGDGSKRLAPEQADKAIAERVNPTYQEEDSLAEKGFRLGGYFRAVLGWHDR